MKKFEYKSIRQDALIGIVQKNFSKGETGWDKLEKNELEKECGIAVRYYHKYCEENNVNDHIKNSIVNAVDRALNELGNNGWELINIEKISPSGFDIVVPGTNKIYHFKKEI